MDIQERKQYILENFRRGRSMTDMGSELGISRERVRQILKRSFGLAGVDGGFRESTRQKRAAASAAKKARQIEKWGMTTAERRAVSRGWMARGCRDPRIAFTEQRMNAIKRGVPFEMTFKEWIDFWGDKYESRGLSDGGLVMCRYGDRGPYKIGNVFMATNKENIRYYWQSMPADYLY